MSKFIIKNKIIVIILVILAILSIVSLASPKIEKEDAITTPLRLEVESATATAGQATIIAGGVTANLQVAPNTIFYDALVQARNEGKISFDGKNYIGLGFLITEIETLRTGDGKYLLYYINGQKASVGVSSYILQDGDVIEWKLE